MDRSNGQLKILLVDDSPEDAFFISRALEKVGLGDCVRVVDDGEEAIRYLCGEGQYADRHKFPFPSVILSDLKMPRVSGFELLRWVRAHPECTVIPTILFSSSAIESDVREAYRLGANSYMVKPTSSQELEKLMRLAAEYWGRCERPPAQEKC
jgi:CheY-like chemotaxis protein